MAAVTEWPTTSGMITGWGPRETSTVTLEPKGWGPAEAAGTVPMTWPAETVELYCLLSLGTNPSAARAAEAVA